LASIARRKIVAGILLDWSIFTTRTARNAYLYPTAPFRYDSAAVQDSVAFFAIDKKINARASMQLIYNHTLGSVDDKFAAAYHNRHFADVY
jgi:hypothetical protein